MNFIFQLKNNGQPTAGLTASFSGTRDEAYKEALGLVTALAGLFRGGKFTVRVDGVLPGGTRKFLYELDSAGHTVDDCPAPRNCPAPHCEKTRLTTTTSRA